MMKKIFSVFALLICSVVFSSMKPNTVVPDAPYKAIKTIIIDAGHGGGDVGARGDYSYEKDICLDIAM